ncbi:response regulator [Dyadobacter tibetensis]|uniref:response regulator n=1 Tax=Dyadobacter tibetensis TaxID=1211851 RepID=UPI00046E9267|nr:response regulator transcription factor [Dyadobacter tibetensis]
MSHILIVDDQPVTWLGMELIVKNVLRESNFHFCKNFNEALLKVKEQPMDLVILDLNMPGGRGSAMITELRKVQGGVRILICTGRNEDLNAPIYIQKGANGFISKLASSHEVERAVYTVIHDQRYVSPSLQRSILNRFAEGVPCPVNPLESLSPREKEIVQLMLQGKWTKEISDALGIKFSTVSTHKARIFEKLEVENILELSKKVSALEEA